MKEREGKHTRHIYCKFLLLWKIEPTSSADLWHCLLFFFLFGPHRELGNHVYMLFYVSPLLLCCLVFASCSLVHRQRKHTLTLGFFSDLIMRCQIRSDLSLSFSFQGSSKTRDRSWIWLTVRTGVNFSISCFIVVVVCGEQLTIVYCFLRWKD